jgi:hypothetical protein
MAWRPNGNEGNDDDDNNDEKMVPQKPAQVSDYWLIDLDYYYYYYHFYPFCSFCCCWRSESGLNDSLEH